MDKRNVVDPINFLRVVAVAVVFLLHTSIFSSQRGFVFGDHTWFLQTPAWGAVWIFFILSGYLIGKSYYYQRYTYNPKGICRFYITRFFKIGVPTWGFVFMCCLLVQPDFIQNNPDFLFKILTFTYNAIPSSDGMSATWYVSTLMQLYLVAPLLCWLIEKSLFQINDTKKRHYVALVVFLICILIGGLVRGYAWKCGVDWSSKVYVPSYMNLDLYICGILINYLLPSKKQNVCIQHWSKYLVTLGLIIFIFINARIYYLGYYTFYQYIFPSIYIIITSLYIYIHEKYRIPQTTLSINAIIKNPLRIIDVFASIAFGFYIFHSLILSQIFWMLSGNTPTVIHIKLIVYAFALTIPFAWMFKIISRESANLGSLITKKIGGESVK